MFRQFALVSAGQICLKQFALKGKVHRRALARKPGDATAYYVETVNKESLYDFAEALADYGFIDAVYPKSVIRISLCRTAKRNPLIFPI